MVLGSVARQIARASRLLGSTVIATLRDGLRLLRAVGAFLWTTTALFLLLSAAMLRQAARLTIRAAMVGLRVIVRGGAIDVATPSTIAHLPPAAAAFAPGGRLHRPTSGRFADFVAARPAIAASMAGGVASMAVAGVIGIALLTTTTPIMARPMVDLSDPYEDALLEEFETRDPSVMPPTPTPAPTPEPTAKPRVVSNGSYGTSARFRPPDGQQAIFWPVPNYSRISQKFHSGHSGWDISASTGEEIVAAVGGTVRIAEYRRGSAAAAGKAVWIQGDDGLWATYNHMSKILVSAGDRVEAGQVIGLIGTTGKTTGPHLHFDLHAGRPYASQILNPAYYLTIP